MIVTGHHRWNSTSRVTNPHESLGRSGGRVVVVPRAAPRRDAERDDDDDASTSDRVGDARRRETRGAFDVVDAFDGDAFDGAATATRDAREGWRIAEDRNGRAGDGDEAVTRARCANERMNERTRD